jgi:uncharacterized protein (TIGR03435 family)
MKIIAPALLAATLAFGQTPSAPKLPQFDAVSIKPNTSDDRGGSMRPIAGGFSAANLSVKMLIQSAYNVKPWQISGGPNWATTDHYDIEAKIDGNPTFQQRLDMLQPLLADRFQLKFHRETRQMPAYSLTLAKNGPKLSATAPDVRGYITPGRGLIEGKAVSMPMLANFLGGSLGQSVTDKTGLAGGFDIKLEWTPTEGESNYTYGDRPLDPNGSSIFTAIQEQLGLKLEAGKAPVELLVIDRVERPSAN